MKRRASSSARKPEGGEEKKKEPTLNGSGVRFCGHAPPPKMPAIRPDYLFSPAPKGADRPHQCRGAGARTIYAREESICGAVPFTDQLRSGRRVAESTARLLALFRRPANAHSARERSGFRSTLTRTETGLTSPPHPLTHPRTSHRCGCSAGLRSRAGCLTRDVSHAGPRPRRGAEKHACLSLSLSPSNRTFSHLECADMRTPGLLAEGLDT